MYSWKQTSLSYLVAHKSVNLLKLFTLIWYHLWHKVHLKFPCEYILPWSNTVYNYLDHPLLRLLKLLTNAPSVQHVLLNILQQTWKSFIQQIIKSYTISNILNKIHQTFRKKIHKIIKYKSKRTLHQIIKIISQNWKFLRQTWKIINQIKKNYTKLTKKLHKT